MKKIVSIVLALVLVLAIAAPAMAITDYEKPDAPTSAAVLPFNGGLSLIAAPQGNTLGILALQSPAANKAYVANEVVFFRVDLNVPAAKDITMHEYDYGKAQMTISSNAAALLGMEGYVITDGSLVGDLSGIVGISGGIGSISPVAEKAALNTTYNTLTIGMPGIAEAARRFVYVGTGIVKAEGKINAAIKGGHPDRWATRDDFRMSTNGLYYIFDNNKNVVYTFGANGLSVVVNGSDLKGNYSFSIQRDANFNVTGITYTKDGIKYDSVYYKSLAQGGTDTFVVGDLGEEDTALAKARLEKMFTFFGFTWEAKGLLLDRHFTQMLNSFYAVDSVDVHLYAGPAITVPDADVDIPQTGDAATTLGFVMIAMAIVAAAAVAYKKVRA